MTAGGYFVTGTDTGVGKTLVTVGLMTALAARGLKVAGMKPVACGAESTPDGLRNDDAQALLQASNVALDYPLVNPVLFEPPIAPHIAAAEAGQPIQAESIIVDFQYLTGISDRVIVEGVGGWAVPLGSENRVSDLAVLMGLPVILVVGLRLGCLNHCLLTLESIHSSGLPLAGWVANLVDPDFQYVDQNVAALRRRIPAPLLARLPWFGMAAPEPSQVAARFDAGMLSRL